VLERLRLEPEPGTTEGFGNEGGIRFYESSLLHSETGERLLTISPVAKGIRITVAQARELHAWLGTWIITEHG